MNSWVLLRSKANGREHVFYVLCFFRFNNSGLTLEFRFLVGIGRSGVMIGRICLTMASQLLNGDKLCPNNPMSQ